MTPELEAKLRSFGDRLIEVSQQNLGAMSTRSGVKAKWKNGMPTSTTMRMFKGRSVASGYLKNNITYELKNGVMEISMPTYGVFVDQGRKGKRDVYGIGSNSSAKGMPQTALERWLDTKNIRPRDLETGQFVPKTKGAMNSMAFLINRKIRWFGIEPTYFFTDAVKQASEEMYPEIEEAVMQSFLNQIQ